MSIGPNDQAWAVYRPFPIGDEPVGWLVDTCAGGTWSPKVFDAMWFASIREAREGIEVTELFAPDLYLVVRVQ